MGLNEYEEKKAIPKLKIYVEQVDKEGKKVLNEVLALWKNKSKDGKTYFTGKLNNVRVVGFLNEPKSDKE